MAVCELCPHLAASRTQIVFGVGNPDAELMFIGEAPGADEDARGEPFVGRAGQLLTRIIETMGFARERRLHRQRSQIAARHAARRPGQSAADAAGDAELPARF